METSTPTFDQLPHVVSGLSDKLDRVPDLLEKAGQALQTVQTLTQTRVCERGLPDNRQVTFDPLPRGQGGKPRLG